MPSLKIMFSQVFYCPHLSKDSHNPNQITLFYARVGDSFVAILVYVDDIIVASKSPLIISQVQFVKKFSLYKICLH